MSSLPACYALNRTDDLSLKTRQEKSADTCLRKCNTFSDAKQSLNIKPYCLKVFKHRWYIVARSPYYETIMIYALDRIHKLQITDIQLFIAFAYIRIKYYI
ncbi:WYL domain-containing protein [Bacteroides oleiciplenus]|uniref:WYL domain-containing protein n=1 Tax=Bacteroides oleiciplenus TaxID=626931 RepID=UPI0026DAC2E6|nr:WYL domain-containing protein [Bacteroides oleiciplenus]